MDSLVYLYCYLLGIALFLLSLFSFCKQHELKNIKAKLRKWEAGFVPDGVYEILCYESCFPPPRFLGDSCSYPADVYFLVILSVEKQPKLRIIDISDYVFFYKDERVEKPDKIILSLGRRICLSLGKVITILDD